MADIAIEDVTKVFPDGTCAVSSVSLAVPDGAFMVLVGPSGCGKTTLLRSIAGLERITDGVIRIGGRIVNALPPKSRDIAMVFQNYALYPHMSVYDNMGFSLRLRRAPRAVIDERVRGAGRALALLDQLAKKPRALSGGQRQRVAMGRAIVREPQAFLMDEPLSNLDAKLRVQMRAELARMQRDVGVTTIYVTHDQTEAMTLGDLVAVMRLGVLQQVDEPQTLFERPANLFVAGFIGSPAMNLAVATLTREDATVSVAFGRHRLRVPEAVLDERPGLAAYERRTLVLGIRPEDMEDAALVGETPADSRFGAAVDLRETLGREAYLHFRVDAPLVLTEDIRELETDAGHPSAPGRGPSESTFIARVSARTDAREGGPVELAVDTRGLHFFDLETGRSIYE